MKLKRLWNILFHWVIPLAILACAGWAVMLLGAKTKAKRKKPAPQILVPVDIVNAKPHRGPLTISASGVVVPFREVDLPTQISGIAVWKSDSLLPGKFVNKGDELLKIDAADYQIAVARLKQQVTKADADLARIDVEISNASKLIELESEGLKLRKREYERMNQLRRDGAGSNSETDAVRRLYVEAKQSLTVQQNGLRKMTAEKTSLQSTRQLASIDLEKAELDLQRTVIRAPFSGVVISNLVEANSHVQVGNTIARIEDTSRVEVRCSLRKEDLDFLPDLTNGSQLDSAASYQLPALPVTISYSRGNRNYIWRGKLSRQDGLGMDQRTRTMPVRIQIENPLDCKVDSPDQSTKPIALVRGMFVQVDLHCKPDRPLVQIPEEAIRPGKKIWIMENEQLRIQPVKIVRIENGVAYVDSEGGQIVRKDMIIRSPVPGAKEGLAVTANAPTKTGPGKNGGKGKGKGGRGKQAGKKSESAVKDGNVTETQSGTENQKDGERLAKGKRRQ